MPRADVDQLGVLALLVVHELVADEQQQGGDQQAARVVRARAPDELEESAAWENNLAVARALMR